MGVLIDASVLIEYERGRLNPTTVLSNRDGSDDEEPMFISTITVSELLHGVHRADDTPRRIRRSVFVEGVIEGFPIIDVDPPTARIHAELRAALASSGAMIGPHDLWLAATCLAHGLSLATANVREFGRVPALIVEDWTATSG